MITNPTTELSPLSTQTTSQPSPTNNLDYLTTTACNKTHSPFPNPSHPIFETIPTPSLLSLNSGDERRRLKKKWVLGTNVGIVKENEEQEGWGSGDAGFGVGWWQLWSLVTMLSFLIIFVVVLDNWCQLTLKIRNFVILFVTYFTTLKFKRWISCLSSHHLTKD